VRRVCCTHTLLWFKLYPAPREWKMGARHVKVWKRRRDGRWGACQPQRRGTSGSRLLTIEVGTLLNQHHNGVGVAAKRCPMDGGDHLIWDAAWLAVPNVLPHMIDVRNRNSTTGWCSTVHSRYVSRYACALVLTWTGTGHQKVKHALLCETPSKEINMRVESTHTAPEMTTVLLPATTARYT
jgi:hypothetical protein